MVTFLTRRAHLQFSSQLSKNYSKWISSYHLKGDLPAQFWELLSVRGVGRTARFARLKLV